MAEVGIVLAVLPLVISAVDSHPRSGCFYASSTYSVPYFVKSVTFFSRKSLEMKR